MVSRMRRHLCLISSFVVALALLSLIASIIAGYSAIPKRYSLGDLLVQTSFPHGKARMPVKCSIQGCLQNDWTLAFSDRKPQAASSLLRCKKALGVCMPGSTTYELLQAFLQMRDQMCTDLGISHLKEDRLDA
jgi:hypothetical protein